MLAFLSEVRDSLLVDPDHAIEDLVFREYFGERGTVFNAFEISGCSREVIKFWPT